MADEVKEDKPAVDAKPASPKSDTKPKVETPPVEPTGGPVS
jgi:hypothetical protein